MHIIVTQQTAPDCAAAGVGKLPNSINDNANTLLDNGSVLSCDSADFLPYPPDMETAGALSPHMAFNAPSSDAVGCSNEKTALPQE